MHIFYFYIQYCNVRSRQNKKKREGNKRHRYRKEEIEIIYFSRWFYSIYMEMQRVQQQATWTGKWLVDL